jgi:hypothetical protein
MPYLAQHKNRPFVSNVSLASVEIPKLLERYQKYRIQLQANGSQLVRPEVDALSFYARNSVIGRIMTQYGSMDDLPPEVEELIDQYHSDCHDYFYRIFYYLFFITIRESRHVRKNKPGWKEIIEKYPALTQWHGQSSFDDSAEVHNNLQSFPPPANLGEFMDFILMIYAKGTFESSYGGKAWWNVTKPLRDFVHGDISAEMLLDTSFTLAHNGGPIFNKGMLYNSYSNSELVMILDVQRAGLIPSLIELPESPSKMITLSHRQYVEKAKKVFPDLCPELSWKKVKEMGAVGDYSHLKSASEKAKEKAEKEAKTAALLKAQQEAAAKLAEEEKMKFEIMPGVFVKKVLRNKEAA